MKFLRSRERTSAPDTQATGTAQLSRRILSLPTLLLAAILAAFVYFLVTRFSVDWNATLVNILQMNPWLYALGFALYYASFVVRGQRWRMLARNTGDLDALPNARLPSGLTAGAYILVGWFVNSITWLRLGDGYRAYLFSRTSGGNFSWSLGTVVAERVLDVAAMLILFAIGAAIYLSTTGVLELPSTVVRVSVVMLVVGALCIPLAMKLFGARLARFLPRRLEAEYHRFHSGTLGSMKQLPMVFLLGITGWLLEIARLYLVVLALGLDAPPSLIVIAALVAALLSTAPLPGGVGFVEPGIIGLLLLTMERHDAVAVALVDRSITYFSVIALGGVTFLIVNAIHARRTKQTTPLHTR